MISVICPAFNAARTVAETLASVQAQTLAAGECFVVDDGSSDETARISRAAGATVIPREPSAHRFGPAVALNVGVAASGGSLLAFIDADDLWPIDKLFVQSRLLDEDTELDAVLGLVQCFLCPSIPAAEAERYVVPASPQPGWLCGALLIRRAAFERVGPFEPTMPCAFIDWCDRARHIGLRFAVPEAVVLFRRIHPGSLSHRTALRDAGYVQLAREAIRRRTSHDRSR